MPQSDFDFQSEFVIANAWRLLEMQDRTPLSPSFGCFDYKYWRDKTSEFADARFQEGALTLALLSLPAYDRWRKDGLLADSDRLYAGFRAGLRQWHAMQYADGSFDEWYKGERGFAAAAFTTIAFGLSVHFLGERMPTDDRKMAVETLRRSCGWLVHRDDVVKTNHDAAGAAALAIGAAVTGEAEFGRVAGAKMRAALQQQRSEGWFPEIGAMDLGYCSVLMDYAMLYVHFSGDQSPLPAMCKLMEFMAPHIHPDGTIAAEGGVCQNGYVGRIGTGLLSAHDDRAGAIVALFSRSTPGQAGLLPTLADDLRFARWSYLPLVVDQLRDHFRASTAPLFAEGWTIHRDCALAAFHRDGLDVYFTAAGGGSVRVFGGGQALIEDLGVYGRHGDERLVAGYNRNRPIAHNDTRIGIETDMGKAGFLYPGFLSRLVLRLGASYAWSSVLLRRIIDRYRLRSSTALNQSATSVVKSGSKLRYSRSLSLDPEGISITDRIETSGPTAKPLALDLRCTSRLPVSASVTRDATSFAITRRFALPAAATGKVKTI